MQILNKYYSSNKDLHKETIDSILQTILLSGKKANVTNEELYLIIDEAVTNAMEHGNKWDTNKKVHIEINADSKNLNINITDEGSGFDTGIIKKNLNKKNVLSSRGRGIYLINQFSKVSWNNKGNEIYLKLKLKE